MIYRRRPSPLHAARAAVGCAYCLALALATLTLSAPIALGAVAVSVVGAGVAAGVAVFLALTRLPFTAGLALAGAMTVARVEAEGLSRSALRDRALGKPFVYIGCERTGVACAHVG